MTVSVDYTVPATPASGDEAAYTYDRDGNRVSVVHNGRTTTYAYDRTDALLDSTVDGVTTAFGYDPYGNLTGLVTPAGLTASTYDLADRLVGLTPPGQPATSYTRDALGRVATRTTATVTDSYAYVATDPVAWRVTTAGSSVSGVIDPGGGRLASSDGSTSTWLLPDLHANLAAALDVATLDVVGASRYDAYGVTLATAAGSSAAGAWGYQGRLDVSPDPAAPLYDFGARPYAPALGVFTSLDTYPGAPADPLSMNRYLYAAGNPATFIDPTGHRYEEGWNPDIHGGSPAPGAPSGGVPEGVDVGPVIIVDPTAPWVDDHTADGYDGLSDASREWLIERHGGDALQIMSTPGMNGWNYPFLYALAHDYIAKYDNRHALYRWETQLDAPLRNHTVEEMDAGRAASAAGNELFWIAWGTLVFGGGYADGAAQLTGFSVAGMRGIAPIGKPRGSSDFIPDEHSVPRVLYPYDRSTYGGAATNNAAGKALREANAGAPCPKCGALQLPRTPHAAVPEHQPPLVEHYYVYGGHLLTSAQRRAWASNPLAFDGTICLTCQRIQGGSLAHQWRGR